MTPPVCEYCRSNWTECSEMLQQQYAEVERLGARRDALLAACEVAYKFARGKHSTLTYWPKNICNQLAAAIEAAREKP